MSGRQAFSPESAQACKVAIARMMREHVYVLANTHGVAIEVYSGTGRALPKARRIQIQEVRGVSSYFTALHELGHIVGPGRSARKLEAEANAWAWALDVAIRPPTPSVRQMIAWSLRSYLAAGRRHYGRRQGMIEPPPAHVFWRLANPQGLTPVEPRGRVRP